MTEKALFDKLCAIEWQLRISQKDALNTEECAQFLGISQDHLRHLANNRDIPHYKCGGKLYFSKKEIDDWRLSERIPTNNEMKEIARTLYNH